MAVTPFPIVGRPFKVTADVNGLIGEFGPAGAAVGVTGVWLFDIVPDASFVGEINIMAKYGGPVNVRQTATAINQAEDALTATAMVGPIPYRGLFVNGAPVTPVSDQYPMLVTPITGRSVIQVASNGLSVGMLFACSAGFAWVFSRPLSGSAAT